MGAGLGTKGALEERSTAKEMRTLTRRGHIFERVRAVLASGSCIAVPYFPLPVNLVPCGQKPGGGFGGNIPFL
jgi:hypothetical protein